MGQSYWCRRPSSKEFVLLVGLCLLATIPIAQAADLEMGGWGLQRPLEDYREISATARQNAAFFPSAKKGEKRYRYFGTQGTRYNEKVLAVMEPAIKAYSEYLSKGGVKGLPEFRQFLGQKYPFILATYKDLAPVLYFDFRGNAAKQFVLKEIAVRVIAYEEYSGGGFSDNQAWYDILLTPTPGSYQYPVGSDNLRFSGSGRAELRFFSNNFYPSGGQSPLGCYMIDVSFTFRVDGSSDITVKTGAFKIDV